MAPTLITIMQMMLLYIPTLSDFCLWGRVGTNSLLNGHYTKRGTRNGYPYFKLDSACDTVYIFWTGSKLEVSSNLNTGSGNYAYCDDGVTHPNACNSWYIYYDGSYRLDSHVYTISGSCPSWNCDQVSIPTLTNGCGGTYDQQIDVNAWKSSTNSNYWFFNADIFKWVCYDQYSIIESCSSSHSYFAAAEGGWIDLAIRQSTQLNFKYPQYYTHTVSCIKNPSPTNNPTPSPTYHPTPSPTNNPTPSPTNNPTPSPTNHPTQTPTYHPTLTPTGNTSSAPTNNPTASPTNNPTASPTNNPTASPTNNPTASPTDNPTISSTRNNGHSSTKNEPISNRLIVSMKPSSNNYAEGAALDTSTTVHIEQVQDSQIDSNENDGSFWAIFAVAISLMAVCIICLCIVIVYKYKQNKHLNDIVILNLKSNIDNIPKNKPNLESAVRINSNSQYVENNDDEKQEVEPDVNPNINIKFGDNKDGDLTVSVDDKGTESSQMYIDFNPENGNHNNVAALIDDYTPNNVTESDNDKEDIERITDDEMERNRGNTMGNDSNYNDYNNNDDGKAKGLLKGWLEYKVKLPQYFDNFVLNGYENLDIIKEITERDELVEIGIVLKDHVVKIMAEIKELNKNIIDK